MSFYILNDEHIAVQETDIMKWARWSESAKGNKRVGLTEINDVKISTVFLGIDHSLSGGPPFLFETMIFGGEHDEYCERYSTWDDAKAGHKKAIELVNTVKK